MLVKPSRCTSKLPDNLEKDYLVAEEKLDGSRYVLYLGHDPYDRNIMRNTFLSRRVSTVDNKHVDRSANLPHITDCDYYLDGTVIDGEIQAEDFLETNSIMNSSPALAVQKQESKGYCTFHAFDVMFYRGKDVRALPLSQRRKILEKVVERMNNEHVKTIPQVTSNLDDYFQKIVSNGGEGIIVKDIRQGYGQGWSKYKKVYDVSAIVTGFKEGCGKYKNKIGSIAVSVMHEGELVEIGYASGFSDELRHRMSEDFEKFKGRIVDIFAQEIQRSVRSANNPVGRLRHPTFHRFRDDLNVIEITSQKLKQDLKTTSKKGRKKYGK